MVNPEEIGKRYFTWIKWGAIAIGCALSYQIAFMALEGLIAWGAFAIVAFLVYTFAPVLAAFIANKKIQAIKAIAAANPIETMQALYAEKLVEFRKQEDAVTEFDTQFQNVSDLVNDLKKTDPEESVQYAAMRDKMAEGLEELRGEQKAAQIELHNAEGVIKKMQRLWTVACAMNKALAASASAQKMVFDQIRQDTAVETVTTNLNRAFASLETAVQRRRTAALFNVPSSPTKELPPAVEVIDITKRVGVTSKIRN